MGSFPNIFQIWYGENDSIPSKYDVFLEHNRYVFEKIDSYRLLVTSEIKGLLEEWGYSLSKFKNFHYRFQSDIVRFVVLYHYGGLYLDLDIKLNNNFFELLRMLETNYKDKDLMLQNMRIYFLWFRKGSPNLKKIIDYYMSLDYLDYDYNIFSLGKIGGEFKDFELFPIERLNLYLRHFVLSG